MDRPLRIAEIDHVVLRCRNVERTLDFYIRMLGLAEERRIPQIGLIQLRAGASMLDLVPAGHPRSEDGCNVDHLCFGIEAADIAEVIKYLSANAIEVIGEPAQRYGARGMGMSVYVRDPEGNIVELKQLPATV